MSATSRANVIARSVIAQFDKLPAKRKPAVRNNGLHEWVPLSGIVAESNGIITCLALSTGMKCLPACKIPQANGNAIHDWHAEVLAMRTFNRFLLDECGNVRRGQPSMVVRASSCSDVPFAIRDDVRLHMYCSEAPCGDASMELIMASQEDASPWDAYTASDTSLLGRADFSQLGVVRRKPSRGDAPPTLSKSCSDKLALKQCTSLLTGLLSTLIEPSNAYIDTLIVPACRYSAEGYRRAFNDRLHRLIGQSWSGGYKFRPFVVETTDEEFGFSRAVLEARRARVVPCNLAAAWTCSGVEESILGGVLRGRQPFEEKGASLVSRRRMWMAAKALAEELGDGFQSVREALNGQTYHHVKDSDALANRRRVKEFVRQCALVGWIPNAGDAGFSIP